MGNQQLARVHAQKDESEAPARAPQTPQASRADYGLEWGSNRGVNQAIARQRLGLQPSNSVRRQSLTFRGLSSEIGAAVQSQHMVIQPKLVIGQPNDKYEQEADQVAKAVMQEVEDTESASLMLENEGEKSSPQPKESKFLAYSTSNQANELSGSEAESKIQKKLDGGVPISESIKNQMEAGFGTDLRHIRLHNDAESTALNEMVGAKAFTTGAHIFMHSSLADLNKRSGKEILAHELAHTLQQGGIDSSHGRSGKNQPSGGLKSTLIQRVETKKISEEEAKEAARLIEEEKAKSTYGPITKRTSSRNKDKKPYGENGSRRTRSKNESPRRSSRSKPVKDKRPEHPNYEFGFQLDDGKSVRLWQVNDQGAPKRPSFREDIKDVIYENAQRKGEIREDDKGRILYKTEPDGEFYPRKGERKGNETYCEVDHGAGWFRKVKNDLDMHRFRVYLGEAREEAQIKAYIYEHVEATVNELSYEELVIWEKSDNRSKGASEKKYSEEFHGYLQEWVKPSGREWLDEDESSQGYGEENENVAMQIGEAQALMDADIAENDKFFKR